MDRSDKFKFLMMIAKKYVKADRVDRSALLDQIVSKLNIHRKSAIRALRPLLSGSTKKSGKKVTKKTLRSKSNKKTKTKKNAKRK